MLPHTKRIEKAGSSGTLGKMALVALASLLVLGGTGSMAFAARSGGVGGGSHGGGFHGGGFHGGGFHGGRFYGGGFHRGFYGHFHGPGFPGWWWGSGWYGLDLYLATLPLGYVTYWSDNVPYYYADGDYYAWNGDVGEYEQVQPPAQIAEQGPEQTPAQGNSLYVYPENGQTPQQQANDEYQCSNWAHSQTAYTGASGAAAQGYLRADAVCLQERGYSVD
jgi:hypothetical protein